MSEIVSEINLIDKDFRKDATYRYALFIQLLNDSLGYCILDISQNKFLVLESFKFKSSDDAELQCETYKEIIHNNENLKYVYKHVKIVFHGQKSTLVPAPLFDEKEMNTYLNFTENAPKAVEVIANKLNTVDAYCIKALPECIKKTLDEFFPNYKLYHASIVMIENLLLHFKHQVNKKKVFVNVHSTQFEILVMEGKKLLLYNSFLFKSPEEFIYYILFVIEQMDLNPENADVTILGEIISESPLYEALYKYIRNVYFINRTETFNYCEGLNTIPPHHFYTLFNLNSCE